MISRSVPHTPSATVRTSTAPSDNGGSVMSSSLAELATPGETVIARIASSGTAGKRVAAPSLDELLCRLSAKSSWGRRNENQRADVNIFIRKERTRWIRLDANDGRSRKAIFRR